MTLTIATGLVNLLGLYVLVGLVFTLPFLFIGVRKIDPAATEGTWGFRVLIIPGVVALWPLLAWRWLRGVDHPPEEKNPHRQVAIKSKGAS